jgi:hypothetical protein
MAKVKERETERVMDLERAWASVPERRREQEAGAGESRRQKAEGRRQKAKCAS